MAPSTCRPPTVSLGSDLVLSAQPGVGRGLPCGLRSLATTQQEFSKDLKRTGAAIAMNRSMDTWVSSLSKIAGLEEASERHKAAFDLNGDGSIGTEELLVILDRCQLYDEIFTPI